MTIAEREQQPLRIKSAGCVLFELIHNPGFVHQTKAVIEWMGRFLQRFGSRGGSVRWSNFFWSLAIISPLFPPGDANTNQQN